MSFDGAFDLVQPVGLEARDFTDPEHRAVFSAIRLLKAERAQFDSLSVFERLRSIDAGADASTLRYLNDLCQSCLSARSTAAHAAIVKDAAARRQLDAAGKALQDAAAGPLRGEALHARVDSLVGTLPARAGSEPPAPPIALEWAADLVGALSAPFQIVEGVLTAGGMSMMFGESNSGKSYLAIHLAICISLGLPWLGRRTERGAVLYVAAEGAWSIRLRLAAYRKQFGRDVGRFGLIPQAVNLTDPNIDVDRLIELIQQQQSTLGEPIALLVIDTVARVMGGGDENAAQDMGRLVSAGDRIRQTTGAHLLYIHHAGKDASKGARGHSSLRAALDTEIEVTADEASKTHTAHVTKQRDLASKGERFTGRFVSVELGTDQWGGAITACAVVDTEPGEAPAAKRTMRPTERQVMGYLAGQATGVRKAVVVEALEGQGVHRASVYRAINDLMFAGLVTETMGLVYVPK